MARFRKQSKKLTQLEKKINRLKIQFDRNPILVKMVVEMQLEEDKFFDNIKLTHTWSEKGFKTPVFGL